MPTIRTALEGDLPQILDCDSKALGDDRRWEWLRHAVEHSTCLLAQDGDALAGFLVLEHCFFGHGFVSLLVVAPASRRKGIGTRLLGAAEAHCKTAKIFTSTNESNSAAQLLLLESGFFPSGRIENLDPGDPELIFHKEILRLE